RRLREQFGRLGGSAFTLGTLENRLEGAVLLPVSEINRLRRAAVGELERLRAQPKRWTRSCRREEADGSSCRREEADGSSCRREEADAIGGRAHPPPHVGSYNNAQLIVLVRNLPQLEAALRCGIETLYCDFENPKKYRDAISQAREFRQAKLFV